MKQSMVRGDVHQPRAAQHWAVTVREWRRSGLKASAFCQERGLALKTFEWWRWALKSGRSSAAAPPPSTKLSSSVSSAQSQPAPIAAAFVEVLPRSPSAPQAAARADLSGVEVVLRHGRSVRVQKHFDGATLRRVVAILEEA